MTTPEEEEKKQIIEDEQEEEETTDASATAAAKKKKKSKKKKKASSNGPFNVFALSEDEFQAYIAKALDATKYEEPANIDELKKEYASYFERFAFSGKLRPGYVSTQIEFPNTIAQPDHAIEGIPVWEQEQDRNKSSTIHVYSEEEIARVRHACKLGREILDIAGRFCRAGVTGDEIDRVVTYACIERECYPSPLNYYGFPKSVCVSVNEVICHGIPDSRKLEDGDIVNIDVSVYAGGMHADLNEMFLIGKVDDEGVNVVRSAYEALARTCRMIKPGVFYRDCGLEITKAANKGGCAVVKTFSGHGVGLSLHCKPTIPHYANNKGVGIMRAGHIFTVEPMLNVGQNWGDMTWPDKWTVTTKDGKRSAQFEHTFLVTETGVEILTAGPGMSKTEMAWDDLLVSRLQRPGT